MQCFFPQNEVKQIQTPLFILNAAYDSWQVIIWSTFCNTSMIMILLVLPLDKYAL